MSPTNLCRLCVKIPKDHKSLYKESGKGNETYELICKYFDSMLLSHEESKHLKVICLECWTHLDNFHKFQINVYEAQGLLAVKIEDHLIKTEVEEIANVITDADSISLAIEKEFISLTAKDTNSADIENEVISQQSLENSTNANVPADISIAEDSMNVSSINNNLTPIIIDDDSATNAESGTDCPRNTNETENNFTLREPCKNSSNAVVSTENNKEQSNMREVCEIKTEFNENAEIESSSKNFSYPATKAAYIENEFISQEFLEISTNSKTLKKLSNPVEYSSETVSQSDKYSSKNMNQSIEYTQPVKAPQLLDEQINDTLVIKAEFEPYNLQDPKVIFSTDDDDSEFIPLPDHSDYSSEDEIPLAKWTKKKKKTENLIDNFFSNNNTDNSLQASEIRASTVDEIVDVTNLDERLAKWLPTIDCVICSESYSKYTNYRQHFAQQHVGHQFFFRCCFRMLTIPSKIEEHLLVHNNPRAFECTLCGTCFGGKLTLHTHKKVKHPETVDTKFKCLKCDKAYTTEKGLRSHNTVKHTITMQARRLQLPDGGIKFACPHCTHTSYSVHAVQSHIYYMHRLQAQHVCKTCGNRFKTLTEWREHLIIHEKRFRCKSCSKLCNSSKSLKRHFIEQHDNKLIHDCEVCPRHFLRKFNLRNHIMKKHPEIYKDDTEVCGKQRTSKSYNKTIPQNCQTLDHKKPVEIYGDDINVDVQPTNSSKSNSETTTLNHPALDRQENPAEFVYEAKEKQRFSSTNVHACSLCPRQFNHLQHLNRHKLVKHSQQKSNVFSNTSDSYSFEKSDVYECPLCYKMFKLFNFLRVHMQTKHTDDVSKSIKIFLKPDLHQMSSNAETNAAKSACISEDKSIDKKDAMTNSSLTISNDKAFNNNDGTVAETNVVKSSGISKEKSNDKKDAKTNSISSTSQQDLDELAARCFAIIKCAECSNSYNKLSVLREHFLQTHINKKFYIICCGRKLKIPYYMEEHFQYHINPEAFKCTECGMCFTVKKSLKGHMMLKHPETQDLQFSCEKCDRKFTSRSALLIHDSIKHIRAPNPDNNLQFSCEKCERKFSSRASLLKHDKFKHSKVLKPVDSSKTYTCECSRKWSSWKSYRSHKMNCRY